MRSNFRTSGQSELTVTEAARRAQILRHTIDVVAERGYAGASLNRIAEHTGISKGLISYHFKGKAALLEALVTDVFQRGGEFVLEGWAAELSPESSPRTMLRAYLEGNLAFIASHARDVGAIVEVIRNHRDAEGRLVFGNVWTEDLYGDLIQIFEAGQAAGEFRRFDPRVMAIAVRRVVDGFTFQVMGSPDVDAAAFTAEVVALFDHATTPMERS
ncbi:TetR/AcrR family transcriptional regulator [Glycomyces sp. A-F 0318]|uniref:TetR/AcrR family transcriptional regulator n=1 Tax=Glycomyces amatae TaxID=2881355 RepID=UPI001E39A503|nr:TetR/AcrR family transcriptional regulator [Glycomyces amatae]MCD0445446.1 TetR/AcrR family transcriptional regulator [Glycomyces amatae]